MIREEDKGKYKEYNHNYYVAHSRHKSKIGQAELKIADLTHENKILEKALELAVADKCKFENALLYTSLGITNGEVAVPKKEQWYLEQAEKEMRDE